MRLDMLHILKQRPSRAADCASQSYQVMRHRMKSPYRRAKSFEIDEEGQVCDMYCSGNLPMRHPQQGYDRKAFRIRVGVLERYLRRQVGQPWNAVYADICKALRHMTWIEPWLKLDWLVRLQPDDSLEAPLQEGKLFVDPTSGLLQRWAV